MHLPKRTHLLSKLIVYLSILGTACFATMVTWSLSACASTTVNSYTNDTHPRYRVPVDATATPTPFLPLLPTLTSTPEPEFSLGSLLLTTETSLPDFDPPVTATPVDLGEFPPPSVYADITIPPPVGLLPQPEGQVNILLLGSDERPEVGGIRTDTLLLLTLNTRLGTASVTSIPRDLYVYIPGWTVQRINTAYAYGEFEAIAMTLAYNLGVWPDHFVLIKYYSFVEAIDSLGGLDVEVDEGISDGFFYLPAGPNHMDGKTALWYVTSRITTSDFDRAHRQQKALLAIFARVLSLEGISRAPELYQIYINNVSTNLRFIDVAPLLPLAVQLSDTTRIHHYFIGPDQVTDYINPSGAMVLLPDYKAILDIMRQALNSP